MATARALLTEATKLLGSTSDSPYLDATVLLAHALGITKEALFARLTDDVEVEAERAFEALASRRAAGTPVAYLRGVREFYGRDFLVDERVLIPRPETEILVDTALELLRQGISHSPGTSLSLHDCCTGTGCVAVTVKAELPQLVVSASDISAEALSVCRENVDRLLGEGEVFLFPADLLEGLPATAGRELSMITANPPYVTGDEVESLARGGSQEPLIALDGGHRGVELPKRLIHAALEHLRGNGYLVMEVGFGQAPELMEEMERVGYRNCGTQRDLSGIDRVVYGRK